MTDLELAERIKELLYQKVEILAKDNTGMFVYDRTEKTIINLLRVLNSLKR